MSFICATAASITTQMLLINKPILLSSFCRIQEVDGGFFEKFGSLFREHAEYTAAQEQIEKERVAEAAAEIVPEKVDEESENEPLPTVDSDTASLSSDSENEGEKEGTDLIATALNVSRIFLM